ncbi:MAG: RidA family protein [Pseudomonadota bacterium]
MRRTSSGSKYERDAAYCRAVICDGWVFVAGTTGTDYATGHVPPGAVAQTELALKNIAAALVEAGCSFTDVVRVTYILPDRDAFPACLPAIRAAFGDAPPAATMIQAGLIDAELEIEIEVTARLPG